MRQTICKFDIVDFNQNCKISYHKLMDGSALVLLCTGVRVLCGETTVVAYRGGLHYSTYNE